jgi:signal transduction histidine kinase
MAAWFGSAQTGGKPKTAGPGSPAPGAYVRVRVQYSGQGMSADVVQRIFDPLFTTKGEKGTGLGLPQVLAFMQLVGGYVNVSSEVGIGTAFDVFFPRSSPAGSSQHDNDRAKHLPAGKRTICVLRTYCPKR